MRGLQVEPLTPITIIDRAMTFTGSQDSHRAPMTAMPAVPTPDQTA